MMFLQWYHGVLKSNHMSFRENVYVRTAPNIALHKQTTKITTKDSKTQT